MPAVNRHETAHRLAPSTAGSRSAPYSCMILAAPGELGPRMVTGSG